ncbi:MAG: hypothetical protein EAZ24_09455 [Burkholderiales bacterium]|nr:MAG: hypothetical protein EAZ24_09455 [Burkholderiales bacterium]TAG80775.1 MAG: hypothetical protein EAZ21_07595 [Betaproteobacteria bacterium]
MRKIAIFLAFVTLVVGGCATYKHVPDGYTGPVAQLGDSGMQLSGGKGELFYVESINGNQIENARNATGRASQGRGFSLTLQRVWRPVKIEPMKLKIVGTHVTAAPIHEIASRAIGEFFTVEGEVEFTPVVGKEYLVVGELTKAQASVWIQDQETKQPVTKKVVAK